MLDPAILVKSLQDENAALRQRIAERKSIEETLRVSEERLSLAVAASRLGVWDWNPVSDEAYLSQEYYELIGYTAGEIQPGAAFFLSTVHPDDSATVAKIMAEHLQGQSEYSITEYRMRQKSGEYRWVRGIGKVVERDEAGLPVRMIGTIYDIAEHKKTEDALRQSEERLREVLENSLDVSYKRNLHTNAYDYVSPAFTRLSGYTPDEMQTLPLATAVNLMHPDDRAEVERVMDMALSGAASTAHQVDYRFKHKDGQYRWLHDQFTVMRDAHGQPVALIGSISDTTERKQMEEALHESVARAQALLQAVPDLMFRMDRQGVFLDYKADVNDLYAQSEPALIGKRNRDVTPPEFADLIDSQIHTTLTTGLLQTFEYQLPMPGKGVRDYEARMVTSGPAEVTAIVRDVTERKLVEETMRESERRFRDLTDNSPDTIYVLDLVEHRMVFFNRPEFCGYSRLELETSNSILTAVHPDEQRAVSTHWQSLLTGDPARAHVIEYRLRRKDSNWEWIQSRETILARDQHDRPTQVLVTLTLITERKRAEDALLQSEAKFRAMIEQSRDGMVLIDERGTIIEWNYAHEHITGISRAEAVGRPAWEVQFQQMTAARRAQVSIAAFQRNLLQMLETGQSPQFQHSLEVQIETASGELRTVMQNAFPIKTDQGHRLGIVVHDITARTQAELLLERRATQLAIINEVGRQIVAALAVDDVLERAAHLIHEWLGYHHVGILVFNQDHTELVLRGRAGNFSHLFAADHRLKIGQGIVGRVAEQGQRLLANDVQLEPSYVNVYGEALPTQAELAVPIVLAGVVQGVLDVQSPLVNAFDQNDVLTQETLADQIAVALGNARLYEQIQRHSHQLEQRVADRTAELQAANLRLTELDRLKDEFLSRISHELRTPLAGILIALELLETARPEKRERFMQRLKLATERLHDMIEDVLLFSQLNRYTLPSTLNPINLNDLIASRLTAWQTLSATHNLAFQLDLAAGLPHARADSELIMQAITRLITNAVNYTPAGSVTVSTACVDEGDHSWVTVNVTDTGPGITPDELPHIFERFYRGRAAADYRTPGTGVGLSICREIAEKLGGRLTVETQVGVGSRFVLWLRVV